MLWYVTTGGGIYINIQKQRVLQPRATRYAHTTHACNDLVVVAGRGPKVLALGQRHPHAVGALAALGDDGVAPPVDLDVVEGEGEELDDGGEGDAAGEGRREDKVVLRISC